MINSPLPMQRLTHHQQQGGCKDTPEKCIEYHKRGTPSTSLCKRLRLIIYIFFVNMVL